MSDQLTNDDLTVLAEALEAWENKDFGTQVMGDVLEMMIFGKDDNSPGALKMRAEKQQRREKEEREKVARKERSLLLRAKLISIRNDRALAEVEKATNKAFAAAAV